MASKERRRVHAKKIKEELDFKSSEVHIRKINILPSTI